MSEFDAAEAAVQAALDAGARYADARVMHRRTESMSARNGEVESLSQDAELRSRRTRAGRVGVGLLRRTRPRDRRRPRRRASGRRDRRRQRAGRPRRVDAGAERGGRGVVGERVHRRPVRRSRSPTRATCWCGPPRRCARTAPTSPRGSTSSGTPRSGSSPARATASTSTSARAAPASWPPPSASTRPSGAPTPRRAGSTAPAAGSSSRRSTSRRTPPGSARSRASCSPRRCARPARPR